MFTKINFFFTLCLCWLIVPVVLATTAVPNYDCQTQTAIPTSECLALIAIYDANPDATFGDGWLETGVSPCTWAGVTCTTMHVTELQFNNISPYGTINLQGIGLTTLPPDINALPNLTRLDASYNHLTALPTEIETLAHLESLALSYNQLTSLPPQIGSLSNLSELLVDNNQLTNLPTEIGDLHNLYNLFAWGNQLTSLPPSIGQLTSLYGLYLSDNEISTLPTTIGDLPGNGGLRLWLDHNQFTELPSSLGDLSAAPLEIDVSHNPLSGPVPSFFTNLPTDTELYFHSTTWCVPAGSAIETWLGQPVNNNYTGFWCNEPQGAIAGQVTQTDHTAVAHTPIVLYRRLLSPYFLPQVVATTHTDANGQYTFEHLGQGIDYYLYFSAPNHLLASQYFGGQQQLERAVAVTTTLGMTTTNVDAILTTAQPPLVSISSTTALVIPNPMNGLVTLIEPTPPSQPADFAVTVANDQLCNDQSIPTAVYLTLGHYFPSNTTAKYPMSATGTPHTYHATVPAISAQILTTDTLILDLEVWCQGNQQPSFPVATIALDEHSGLVTEVQTGEIISGAVVTLHQVPNWRPRKSTADTAVGTCESAQSKHPQAPWSQPAPTDLGIPVNTSLTSDRWAANSSVPLQMIDPASNQRVTASDGAYGWRVPSGCWYATVQADGYQPFTSPVVGVNPFTHIALLIAGMQTRDALPDLGLSLTPTSATTTTYTLTTTITGTGNGAVSSFPAGISCGTLCSAPFTAGTIVTLTAVAEPESTFSGWTGACSGTADCLVTMDATQAVTATFDLLAPEIYTLTVATDGTGNGTVSSFPAGISCGALCYAPFTAGTIVTLTAVAEPESTFSGWTGACSGTADCLVTMDTAQAVTATFDLLPPPPVRYALFLPIIVKP